MSKRIRITKCDNPHSWYYGLEGREFTVLEDFTTLRNEPAFIVEKGRIINSFVLEKDCVVF
jgi:hypothetical protein